jgi:hypothetical protein
MIDSYLITENTLTSVDTEQMRRRVVMRMAGFQLTELERHVGFALGGPSA